MSEHAQRGTQEARTGLAPCPDMAREANAAYVASLEARAARYERVTGDIAINSPISYGRTVAYDALCREGVRL